MSATGDKKKIATPSKSSFNRAKLEDLLKQRFFYDQSFSIYGGIQGLYDYGPLGCAIKSNLLDFWRQFFILQENMLEVDCSILTPEPVLKSSGHVDRFTDFLVKNSKTGDCYRADHLIEAALEAKLQSPNLPEQEKQHIKTQLSQLDNYQATELDALIIEHQIRAPNSSDLLTPAVPYNLMFATSIGPSGTVKAYLRPETAQGMFVNFGRLLQFNQGRLPFSAAQIGKSFRNEIAPRSGLIRVREFVMAEVEHFLDPRFKQHPKFPQIQALEARLLSADAQEAGQQEPVTTKFSDAVDQGLIANQTLAYFLARIQLFLVAVGVDPARLRFRQHMRNEMAHYACDCWDAECHTSYGWVECVGCADRACYDLSQHAQATGARLTAEIRLDEPKQVNVIECLPEKSQLGKLYKKEASIIYKFLESLDNNEAKKFHEELKQNSKKVVKIDGHEFVIGNEMVLFRETSKVVHVEEITPNVIEPSFGIGRIMYAVFEHSFRVREGDENRSYLALAPRIAPYKCSVLPLSRNPDFCSLLDQISSGLTALHVTHRVDDSAGSVGRRYARTDQIAIPFGITVDFDSINVSPPSVTVRERDSMVQVRVPVDRVCELVRDLADGRLTWEQAKTDFPIFEQQETGVAAKDD